MNVETWLKMLGIVGAVGSFLWGVYQWREKSAEDLLVRQLESERLIETRRIEATKPFLERQLALYSEATKVAAQVATLGQSEAGKKARARFWELYWGELALVENRAVEAAMKRMGDALRADMPQETLQYASLAVAHACRESLDKSWGIRAWSAPDEAASATKRVP